jgi:hypothetical protein
MFPAPRQTSHGVPERQIQGNRAAHRTVHKPVENGIDIRSGTLDDAQRSPHG